MSKSFIMFFARWYDRRSGGEWATIDNMVLKELDRLGIKPSKACLPCHSRGEFYKVEFDNEEDYNLFRLCANIETIGNFGVSGQYDTYRILK